MIRRSDKTHPVRSSWEILRTLKMEGPADSKSLAERVGISAMAVRQHLFALERQKLIKYHKENRPIGRPAKIWSLKPAAESFFPDLHAELATGLIQGIKDYFGEHGLHLVISIIAKNELEVLTKRLNARDPIHTKLKALAKVRSRQGYLTELKKQDHDGYLLICSHCPIRTAAMACGDLCQLELSVFRDLLNPQSLERLECMTSGARRCVYRVTEAGG